MNKKVGAVAFSGSSIVAAVYVQLLDLPIYTENILVLLTIKPYCLIIILPLRQGS